MNGTPAQYLYIFQGFTITTQGFDNFIPYGQSNGITIQANVLDTIQSKVFTSVRQFDDAIDEYYNDKMLEKTIMQIRK